MIIYVDIDETICMSPEDRNYALAEPLVDMITETLSYTGLLVGLVVVLIGLAQLRNSLHNGV